MRRRRRRKRQRSLLLRRCCCCYGGDCSARCAPERAAGDAAAGGHDDGVLHLQKQREQRACRSCPQNRGRVSKTSTKEPIQRKPPPVNMVELTLNGKEEKLKSPNAPLPGLPRGVRGPDRLPPGPAGDLRRQGRTERQQSIGRRREPVRDELEWGPAKAAAAAAIENFPFLFSTSTPSLHSLLSLSRPPHQLIKTAPAAPGSPTSSRSPSGFPRRGGTSVSPSPQPPCERSTSPEGSTLFC